MEIRVVITQILHPGICSRRFDTTYCHVEVLELDALSALMIKGDQIRVPPLHELEDILCGADFHSGRLGRVIDLHIDGLMVFTVGQK